MRAIAALLSGPAWRPTKTAGDGLAGALPLLVLALCTAAAGLAGLVQVPHDRLVRQAWHVLPTGAAATLLSLLLALPASLARPGLPWLLPAWACIVGEAGWSLIDLPRSGPFNTVRVAGLLLPFMVAGLAASWGRVPRELPDAAAASGAAPLAALHLAAPLAWPIAVRTVLVTLALAVGFLTGWP